MSLSKIIKTKSNLISFLVVIVIIARGFFLIHYFNSDLKKSGVVVAVKIISVNSGFKAGGGFQCLVNYKGKSFERPSGTSIKRGRVAFIGKNFPGIYSPNTNSLKVLITPEDFEKFAIPFPDSLKWVLSYISGK